MATDATRARRGTAASARRPWVVPVVLLAVFAFVVTGVYAALTSYGSTLGSGTCTARGLGTTHSYSTEQTANAATIAATAMDRGLPPRAASIALATAYQESKLQNIDHGDRDSLGLFQQRPSQGWGTRDQILDPIHATNAFYDVLVKIPGYASADITTVAQKVQRSGFPEAYRDHETEGRIFASSLTGRSGANLVCDLDAATGTASPQTVLASLQAQFPRRTKAGTLTTALAPASSAAPAVPTGAGATALVIDPHGDSTLGWAVANWAVARASSDSLVQVSYGGRTWERSSGKNTTPGTWSTTSGGDPAKIVLLVSGG